MAIYPPIIQGSLKPMIFTQEKKYILTIPFEFGRGTIVNNIKQIGYIIRSIVEQKEIVLDSLEFTDSIRNNKSLTIELSDDDVELVMGQYYKIQLGFADADNGRVTYYSTAGTFKVVDEPKLTIEENGGTWIGKYKADHTSLERSQFILKDQAQMTIVEKSKEIYHNLANLGIETYRFNSTLSFSKVYTVEWKVINDEGMEMSIISDPISGNTELLNSHHNFQLQINCNKDDGVMEIGIYESPPEGASISKEIVDYGSYVISRASEKDNFESWEEIYRFENLYSFYVSSNLDFPLYLIKDINIQFGINYQYCIQQYNQHGVRSLKYKSPIIKADFDHTYLCDEDRQLCLKFNPKVSSMKTVKMESKQNTLGGAYPIIFRNGETDYKEFSISGLISYLQDENGLFGFAALDAESPGATDLTCDNFAKEKDFKLQVLDWLNDGKPKLLKSPAEGNYLVQLMNVSLSPTDTLGRMLHSFQANATEVEGTIKPKILLALPVCPVGIESIELKANTTLNYTDRLIKDIMIFNWLENQTTFTVTLGLSDSKEITIHVGRAGYHYESPEGVHIVSITCNEVDTKAQIFYEYLGAREQEAIEFDNKKAISSHEEIGQIASGVTEIYSIPVYYKVLQLVWKNSENIKVQDVCNKFTYTTPEGEVKTFQIGTQLRLEDIVISKLSIGSNLIVTYCRIVTEEES